MAIAETTGEMDAYLKGATSLARLPLGEAALKAFGTRGGHLDIVQLKGADATYAVVAHGGGLFEREMLSTGDDLAQLLQISSTLANAKDAATADLTRSALAVIARPAEPHELTPQQVAVSEAYADGDFSYLAETARTGGLRAYDRELSKLGDGFFAYIMRELDPREDCDSHETALGRIQSLVDDLATVEAAVQNVEAPAPGR